MLDRWSSEEPVKPASNARMGNTGGDRFGLPVPALLTGIMVAFLLVSASPAFALWLPWAKEEDKVKAAVTDLWRAVASRDKRTLSQYLVGPSVDSFISMELEQAAKLNVSQYKCRFTTVAVDQANQSWAWAAYEKIAVRADGTEIPSVTVSRLKKVDGYWKIMIGTKTPEQEKKEKEQRADQVDEALEKRGSTGSSRPGQASSNGVTVEVSE